MRFSEDDDREYDLEVERDLMGDPRPLTIADLTEMERRVHEYGCSSCGAEFNLPRLSRLVDVTCSRCGAGYADVGRIHPDSR
jgi:uncharacterized paraquat-inducible protein A